MGEADRLDVSQPERDFSFTVEKPYNMGTKKVIHFLNYNIGVCTYSSLVQLHLSISEVWQLFEGVD